MAYRSSYDPELYTEFKDTMDQIMLLKVGEEVKLKVEQGVYMAAQRIRELFRFTAMRDRDFTPRQFSVKVNVAEKTITITKRPVRQFGIATVGIYDAPPTAKPIPPKRKKKAEKTA